MANNKATLSATEVFLKREVPIFIKADLGHAKKGMELFKTAAAFAIFHGNMDYLNMLKAGVSAGTKAMLTTFLQNINKAGLKTLFDGHSNERNDVLAAITSETAKLEMRVTVFGKDSKTDLFQIGTSKEAKAFKSAVIGIYQEIPKLVEAFGRIEKLANDETNARADRAFEEFDYLANVVGTFVRKMATKDESEARRVATVINNLIQDETKKRTKGQIDELIKKYINDAKTKEEPKAPTVETPKVEVKAETPKVEVKAETPKAVGSNEHSSKVQRMTKPKAPTVEKARRENPVQREPEQAAA